MAATYRFLAINDINNGILKAPKAMPQKDITSNNENTFSMNRHTFVRQTQITKPIPMLPSTNQRKWATGAAYHSFTSVNGIVAKTNKKWMGGNRDSSSITSKRRVNAIGENSLNKTGVPMSFTTIKSGNDVRDAKHRVRSGGSIVPPAVTHKYVGAPVFY
jgi:hypothetical protein